MKDAHDLSTRIMPAPGELGLGVEDHGVAAQAHPALTFSRQENKRLRAHGFSLIKPSDASASRSRAILATASPPPAVNAASRYRFTSLTRSGESVPSSEVTRGKSSFFS